MHLKYLLKLFLSILSLSVFIAIVQADEFNDALNAYQNKHYSKAIKLFKALAEQGDSRGWYNLGLAYRKQGAVKSKLAQNSFVRSQMGGLIDSYLLISTEQSGNLPQAWLFRQDEDSYTLQLATGKTPESLKKLKQQIRSDKKLAQPESLNILGVKVVDKQVKKTYSTRYILVYGVFNSYQTAKAEVASLPASLKKSSPWIRQFRELQSIVYKDSDKK